MASTPKDNDPTKQVAARKNNPNTQAIHFRRVSVVGKSASFFPGEKPSSGNEGEGGLSGVSIEETGTLPDPGEG